MDRRSLIRYGFMYAATLLTGSVASQKTSISTNSSKPMFLRQIQFAIPAGMTKEDLWSYQQEVVDVDLFNRIDEDMIRSGLLLKRDFKEANGTCSWYYLFKDKAAFHQWEARRPQYGQDNKLTFLASSFEISHGDLQQSPLAFLING